MFVHYLTIAFRHLKRDRFHSTINLLGLSIGICSSLLILLYVIHEFSYDRFHQDVDRTYRVVQRFTDGSDGRIIGTGVPMGPNLKEDFPEIESVFRTHPYNGLLSVVDETASGGTLSFQEDYLMAADENFFQFFSFELLEGDPNTLLSQPLQIVLTESLAQQFFGDASPLGKEMRFENKYSFIVSGVMADPPSNSHLQFSGLVSFASMNTTYQVEQFSSWWWPSVYTYVKMQEGVDVADIDLLRLSEFGKKYRGENNEIVPRFQAMGDIHLLGYPEGSGTQGRVLLFLGIACVVLLVACLNYINLATARATRRAKEVGIRKASGALRKGLVGQFLSESLLMTFLSLLFGLALTELSLPLFNQLSGMELQLNWGEPLLWICLLGVGLLVSLLAGLYPALYLSGFQPLAIFRKSGSSKSNISLRRVIVVAQLTVSLSLIICTLGVWRQHRFMTEKSLGFDQEQLVSFKLADAEIRQKVGALKNRLEQLPEIKRFAAGSWVPGSHFMVGFPGRLAQENGEMKEIEAPNILYMDHNFLETVGIGVKEGRAFDPQLRTDVNGAIMINPASTTFMGDGPYLDRQAWCGYYEYDKLLYEKKGKIIGITEEFHARDLRSAIGPTFVVLADSGEQLSYFMFGLVRLHPGDMQAGVEAMGQVWREMFPNRPFEYAFVDEELAVAYEEEARIGRMIGTFAGLAIFIACLGLLGLASFLVRQRTKEIGIRKVMGASVSGIVLLLNREFLLLLAWAGLGAMPLSYGLMQHWLEDYPYQVPFSLWPYFVALLSCALLTWLSVSWQSWRAAKANPVDSLHYE